MDEAPLGNMLPWRSLLPSAVGTAEPRPGGRGGAGGEGGSRCGRVCSHRLGHLPPARPNAGLAPPASPRLASPGPGQLSSGCRGSDLPRSAVPGRAPRPPWTEAAAGRAGRRRQFLPAQRGARRWGGLDGATPRLGPLCSPGEQPCLVRPVAFGFPGSAVSTRVQRSLFTSPESTSQTPSIIS